MGQTGKVTCVRRCCSARRTDARCPRGLKRALDPRGSLRSASVVVSWASLSGACRVCLLQGSFVMLAFQSSILISRPSRFSLCIPSILVSLRPRALTPLPCVDCLAKSSFSTMVCGSHLPGRVTSAVNRFDWTPLCDVKGWYKPTAFAGRLEKKSSAHGVDRPERLGGVDDDLSAQRICNGTDSADLASAQDPEHCEGAVDLCSVWASVCPCLSLVAATKFACEG